MLLPGGFVTEAGEIDMTRSKMKGRADKGARLYSDFRLLVFFLLPMFSCLNLRRTSPAVQSPSKLAVISGCPFCQATKENGFDVVYEVRIIHYNI